MRNSRRYENEKNLGSEKSVVKSFRRIDRMVGGGGKSVERIRVGVVFVCKR